MKDIPIFLGAGAIAAMAATPVSAIERNSAPVDGQRQIGGEISALIIGLLVVAAVMAGLILIVDKNDDAPVSP